MHKMRMLLINLTHVSDALEQITNDMIENSKDIIQFFLFRSEPVGQLPSWVDTNWDKEFRDGSIVSEG